MKYSIASPACAIACAAFATTVATCLVVGSDCAPSRSNTSNIHVCSFASASCVAGTDAPPPIDAPPPGYAVSVEQWPETVVSFVDVHSRRPIAQPSPAASLRLPLPVHAPARPPPTYSAASSASPPYPLPSGAKSVPPFRQLPSPVGTGGRPRRLISGLSRYSVLCGFYELY